MSGPIGELTPDLKVLVDAEIAGGGGGGSLPVLTQAGAPDGGGNADFNVAAGGVLSSGTFKLTFEAVTTAAIAWNATMTDIATAMSDAYGSEISRPYIGDEEKTPNDTGYVVFGGALGAAVVASPTVSDDTTDGGIVITDDQPGSAPVPAGELGQMLIDTDDGTLYVRVEPQPRYAPSPVGLGAWRRVSFASTMSLVTPSVDGLQETSVRLGIDTAAITVDTPSGSGQNISKLELNAQTAALQATDPDEAGHGTGEVRAETAQVYLRLETIDGGPLGLVQLSTDGLRLNIKAGLGVFIPDLPTSPPAGYDQVWNNGGVLTITGPPPP